MAFAESCYMNDKHEACITIGESTDDRLDEESQIFFFFEETVEDQSENGPVEQGLGGDLYAFQMNNLRLDSLVWTDVLWGQALQLQWVQQ